MYSYTEQFPLRKIQKLAEWHLYIRQMKKIPILKQVKKAETHLAIIPSPASVLYDQEGISNSQLLPEQWRVWAIHLLPQLLQLSPKGQAPEKHLALKVNGACILKTHKIIANKEVILNVHISTHQGYPPRVQCREIRQKHPSFSLPRRNLSAYFTSCCLRVQL